MTNFTPCGSASPSTLSTRPWCRSWSRLAQCSCQQTGDPVAAQQLAVQALENLRQQQASALAYFDVFLMLSVVTLALVPVVLLMKRSVAEKGTRIGGE